MTVDVRVGMASERGVRRDNQDYAGATVLPLPETVVAAIGDGVAGNPGGRVAAETAVRDFIDAYLSQPEENDGADRILSALRPVNGWIHAIGLRDPELSRMATTFTALILRGRDAYCVHLGDSRLYRLNKGRLSCLTVDHVVDQAELSHVLTRAIGLEASLHADCRLVPSAVGDRFLLCSDGVHGVLTQQHLHRVLRLPVAPEECARLVVREALASGSQDNATAVIIDILSLPIPNAGDIALTAATLPPAGRVGRGEIIDGYLIETLLSDSRNSKVYLATDTHDQVETVLKFPKSGEDGVKTFTDAFIREAWVSARVSSPWLGAILDPGTGRRSCLYTVMPYYEGETLARRLRRFPKLKFSEGLAIGIKLAKAVTSLHRADIIHGDIKPDNIILETGGGLRLIDFGVASIRGRDDSLRDFSGGTPSYIAPELFVSGTADERSDIYAIGVTLYEAFSGGAYPYGEIEPFMKPSFGKATPMGNLRQDLPARFDAAIMRAIALRAEDRFPDAMSLCLEFENNLNYVEETQGPYLPLYARYPIGFWKVVSAVLAVALLMVLKFR